MTERDLDERGPAHETIRGKGLPREADTPLEEPGAEEVVIKPIDQMAARSDTCVQEEPPFARTFRLSLRHSFNELLKPLNSLAPEHDVIPSWVGGGYDVLRCGHCDFAIAECVDIEQMRRLTLYCPRCAAENQVP